MRLTFGRQAAALAGCGVLVTVALASGVAVAVSTTSSGVIHACANDTTGALSLHARCQSGSRTVTWNATGPRGLPGARGNPGRPGSTGPSDTYYTTAVEANVSNTYTSALSLRLPAGSYLVEATAEMDNTSSLPSFFDCYLVWPSGATSSGGRPIQTSVIALGTGSMAVSGVGTLAAAGKVELQCLTGASTALVVDPTLTATKVGALTAG
jgi:hypothetical protein